MKNKKHVLHGFDIQKSETMKIVRPHFIFDGIQIKSEECFHLFAEAVGLIEERCGIHETRITLKNIFFCPYINRDNCRRNEFEIVLIDVINRIDPQ